MAQSPESLNYQAVVRDADGAIRANQVTSVDFNIRQGAADGTIVYSEMHDPTSNEFGLVNVKIGAGTAATGNFAAIDWSAGPYFLEVLLNDVSAGTQEFSSVPFSLYAKRALSAATADEAAFAATAENATNATMADFATAAGTANDDNDRSPTNEIQTLSINDRTISLSDGGAVTLPENVELWDSRSYAISPAENRSVGIGTANPSGKFEVVSQVGTGTAAITAQATGNSGNGIPSGWQSFTATQTGFITEVNAFSTGGFVVGQLGRLNIYAGTGTSGRLLHSQVSPPSPQFSSNVNIPITQPVSTENGQVYTVQIVNFGWLFATDPYPGGRCNFNESSDCVFSVTVVDQIEEDMTIAVSNGRVGIGTIQPREKLEVVGNICYTGTIGACSDERYKKNFANIESPLAKVQQLNGLYYDWKQEEFPEREFTDERQIGVIAQEVEALFPEIVLTGDDGYKSVDYGKLTPILLEAIKEQQAIIEAMKTETNQLRASVLARLDALEGKATPETTQIQTSKK
ncbi:MAG: tail fiber domain-containing protein [Lewinella sp.]